MSRILDAVGHYLAHRKGLLPLLGLLLVLGNLLLRILAPQAWLSGTDLLLHVGILVAILGFLLARVL
jgi:preprotein translocase subunit SecY